MSAPRHWRWPRPTRAGWSWSWSSCRATGGSRCRVGAFTWCVSNPPYIAGDDPHLHALRHEPALALSPGGDGLAALAQIVRGAPAHLHAGGWLLLEHGHDQQPAVQQLLVEAGFVAVGTRADLAGRPRCSGGRLPPC